LEVGDIMKDEPFEPKESSLLSKNEKIEINESQISHNNFHENILGNNSENEEDISSKRNIPNKGKPRTKGKVATAYLTKVAILTALSVVLYLFARFPIFPIFPYNVLDMDFSSIPSLLGGFALGPMAAVIIEFVKCSIKLITSTTGLVGELSNFIVSVSLVLPATFFYKYNKNIKGAIIGLLIGVLSNALISSLSNYFIIVPMYAKLYLPMLMDLRIEFSFQYGLAFNLIKSISTSLITFLLYKRVSKLLHL